MSESRFEASIENLERLLSELRRSLESRSAQWTPEQENRIEDGLQEIRKLVNEARETPSESSHVLPGLERLRREAWLGARLAHSRLLYHRWLTAATQSATTYGAKGALIPEESRKSLGEV